MLDVGGVTWRGGSYPMWGCSVLDMGRVACWMWGCGILDMGVWHAGCEGCGMLDMGGKAKYLCRVNVRMVNSLTRPPPL